MSIERLWMAAPRQGGRASVPAVLRAKIDNLVITDEDDCCVSWMLDVLACCVVANVLLLWVLLMLAAPGLR